MSQENSSGKLWNLKMTEFGRRTENPLRRLWEAPKIITKSKKKPISLQIGTTTSYYSEFIQLDFGYMFILGDPTIFKNFKAARESIDALKNALEIDSFSYTVINYLLSVNN